MKNAALFTHGLVGLVAGLPLRITDLGCVHQRRHVVAGIIGLEAASAADEGSY